MYVCNNEKSHIFIIAEKVWAKAKKNPKKWKNEYTGNTWGDWIWKSGKGVLKAGKDFVVTPKEETIRYKDNEGNTKQTKIHVFDYKPVLSKRKTQTQNISKAIYGDRVGSFSVSQSTTPYLRSATTSTSQTPRYNPNYTFKTLHRPRNIPERMNKIVAYKEQENLF